MTLFRTSFCDKDCIQFNGSFFSKVEAGRPARSFLTADEEKEPIHLRCRSAQSVPCPIENLSSLNCRLRFPELTGKHCAKVRLNGKTGDGSRSAHQWA